MQVVANAKVPSFELPGLEHRTVAGHVQGVKSVEVWMQTIAPGAATPVHCHACEEIIVVLSGSGECTADGETNRFGPDSTLILEPDIVHEIVNTSDEPMRLVAVFGTARVRVKTGEGEPLPLPWQAP